jgi:hypothetical protein
MGIVQLATELREDNFDVTIIDVERNLGQIKDI